MNRLTIQKRAQIISCLVEGNSIRSTVRMTGAAKNTVTTLLKEIGNACLDYQDEHLRGLECKRIQCDEIWSFCYAKKKNVPKDKKGQFGYGDVWTWTAICADSKLIPCWLVGSRDAYSANEFMHNLADRFRHRIQLTTDGHRPYLEAVNGAFGLDVDYAMLVKTYGEPKQRETRYSPPEFVCATKRLITGDPDPKDVSTSYTERQNLTMRMSMRRFTRLTNAFSKKIENLQAAVSLYFMYYNYGRVHSTLKTTPAIKAGLEDHVWSLEEIAGLFKDSPPKKRGPYKIGISN